MIEVYSFCIVGVCCIVGEFHCGFVVLWVCCIVGMLYCGVCCIVWYVALWGMLHSVGNVALCVCCIVGYVAMWVC